MSTKLYLTSVPSDLAIDTLTYTAIVAGANPGASSNTTTTLITNTQTNPGTPVQMTATAGGSVVCWATPALAAATNSVGSGTVTLNIRGLESNASANAAFVIKITKYSGGSETATIWNNNQTNVTELTTSDAVNGPSAAAGTSTNMAAGDRFIIRLYIANASGVQMATGFTTTASYDGFGSGAAGDSWVQFTETCTFRGASENGTFVANPQAMTTSHQISRGTLMAAPLSTNYIMRAKGNSGAYLFWLAPVIDTTGAYVTTTDTPLSNIVVDKVIRS